MRGREDAICMPDNQDKNKDTHPQSLLSHGKKWLRELATLYVKCAFPLLFIYKYQSSKVGKSVAFALGLEPLCRRLWQ
jgi:hypothetical protein